MQPGDKGKQFAVPARIRQRRVTNVVVHVEVVFLFPANLSGYTQGPHFQLVTKGPPKLAVIAQNFTEIGEKGRIVYVFWQGEQVQSPHMHGNPSGLHNQKKSVCDWHVAHCGCSKSL